MNTVNRVLEVTKSLIEDKDVPNMIMSAQHQICQLYQYDYGRSFLRIQNTMYCMPLHICGLGKEPIVCTKESGIDIYKANYHKDDVTNDEILAYLLEKTFVHTKDFEKYISALESIGYIPIEGKTVTEASIRFVRGEDAGMFGFFVFERYDEKNYLTQEELDEINILLEVLTNKIENFETRKKLIQEEKYSSIDSLTGLMNVSVFKEKVSTLLETECNYAMMYLDIDKFKYINELWSHKVGSEILVATGQLLQELCTEQEVCCRIADDKFGVLIEYIDSAHLEEKVAIFNEHLQMMQKTQFPDVKITVIGGVYEITEEHNVDFILDKANIARVSSKGTYDNTCVMYNQCLEDLSKREKELENKTNYALENNQFIPYLQPKFNTHTNKICGAEALVRWKTEDKLISPYEFIEIFEKNGFIRKLDFVIYQKVFEFMEYCTKKGYPIYPTSLNVSRKHMQDQCFLSCFNDLMKQYNIDPSYIELEITESVFMDDKDMLKQFIETVKKEGIKISIDDFGTAYSALNLLSELDVDTIKLDKSFIDNLDNDEGLGKDKIIIQYIIKMIKDLHMEAIFEGIETQEQLDFIKESGCLYGQGYIFSKPLSLEDFEATYLQTK